VKKATPLLISELFAPEPPQWALRGDAFLWREMREHFHGAALPSSAEALQSELEQAFQFLTGHPLSHAEPIFLTRHSHGGMSSGHVVPEFWRTTAFPLLVSRFPA